MKVTPDKNYDILIIGAGIVGAGIFRDAASHGLKTLLIDKNDFCDRTSASSSKMLHGGIRYLENFDFALVFEALKEKKLWVKLAPHLNYHQEFYLPLYKDSLRKPIEIKTGITLYDFLAKNPFRSPKWLNKDSVKRAIPSLKQGNLKGAGVYMDAIMDDRKLGLELILNASKHSNADAINHIKYISHNRINKNEVHVELEDTLTGEKHKVITKQLIFAAGPFVDQILGQDKTIKWQNKVLASKGSHVYIKNNINLEHAIVMTPKDGRLIFLIPREKNRLLFGTTELGAPENFDFLDITKKETQYLIANFNEYFPDHKISNEDIIGSYAGVRPLIKTSSSSLGKTARTHEIYNLYNNISVVAGGKYTTFRVMAKETIKPILMQLGVSYQEQHSLIPVEKMSQFYSNENTPLNKTNIENVIGNEFVRNYQDLKNRVGISDFWNNDSKELKETYQDLIR